MLFQLVILDGRVDYRSNTYIFAYWIVSSNFAKAVSSNLARKQKTSYPTKWAHSAISLLLIHTLFKRCYNGPF